MLADITRLTVFQLPVATFVELIELSDCVFVYRDLIAAASEPQADDEADL
jgi:hypothetical protein